MTYQTTGWVTCPICGCSDMPWSSEGDDGGGIIICSNLACGSNGGDNFDSVELPQQPLLQERPATNKDVELNIGGLAIFGFVFWLLSMVVLDINLSTIRHEATANTARELKAIQEVGKQVKAATQAIKERDVMFVKGKAIPFSFSGPGGVKARWLPEDEETMRLNGWGRLWKEEKR